MFNVLKKAFKATAKEVTADYSQNKNYLEAVAAVAALVANADGDIEPAERTKAVSVIASHPKLGKMYDQRVIKETADQMFERARDFSGRQSLAKELDDIKADKQMAEDVYAIGVDIAMADGDMEPAENEMLKKIAARLQIDASQFEF